MLTERLTDLAAEVCTLLKRRGETVAVAESSVGGLISAALLALPGASAYFLGGGVVYTTAAKKLLVGVTEEMLAEERAATETHALHLARAAQRHLGATWGIGETGATGPTGNRYGDPPGHTCVGVSGPVERAATVRTGLADREENMVEFSTAALELLRDCLEAASA